MADNDAAPEDENLAPASLATSGAYDWRQCWLTLGAGTTGGVAGLLGGLAFGFAAAAQAQQSGIGALSALLVLVALATLLALIGAAGVVGGIAVARLFARDFAFAGLMGGAVGGLLVGAFGKLIAHDAFLLLSGQAPGDITGALEGLLLGGAVGLADDLGRRFAADWRDVERNIRVVQDEAGAPGGSPATARRARFGSRLCENVVVTQPRSVADVSLRSSRTYFGRGTVDFQSSPSTVHSPEFLR